MQAFILLQSWFLVAPGLASILFSFVQGLRSIYLGPYPWLMEVPRLEVNQSYSRQPTPQP